MLPHNSTYVEKVYSTISLSILYTMAVCCCGLVLFVTYHGKLYRTRVNLLLANCTFADFLLNVICLIFEPPNIMSDTHWLICNWVGWLIYVTGLQATWFVPVVVLNRYFSIFHQNLFKRIYTTRNIIYMICAGWMTTICITLPFHLGGRTGYEWQFENCGINTEDSTTWQSLVYVLVVLPTFTGNGVTAFCNFRIFLKLRDHAKNGSNVLKNNVMSQNKQLMYVTLLHTLFAVCLQSPYILGKLFPIIVEGNILRLIFPCFFVFNSTVSSLTTLYVVKPYRNAVKNLIYKGKPEAAIPSMVASTVVIRHRFAIRSTITVTPSRQL